MAKRRMVSKSISCSTKIAQLYSLAPEMAEFAQLLYTWFILHTDDYGQISADPLGIKLLIVPASPRPAEDFEAALQLLKDAGLLISDKTGKVLKVVNFEQFQTFRGDRTRLNDFEKDDLVYQ